jgi:hypothetical protein
MEVVRSLLAKPPSSHMERNKNVYQQNVTNIKGN